MPPIRVVVYSDVTPHDDNAGGVVLRRHLTSENIEWVAIHPTVPKLTRITERLQHTRFSKLATCCSELLFSSRPNQSVVREAEAFNPDLVLTVASGMAHRQAPRLAKILNIPLVTIWHDWHPDCVPSFNIMQKLRDSRFRHVFKLSNVNLPVCEGMQNELGQHSNSHVLLPIPGGELSTCVEPKKPLAPFKVGYAGNLFHYGPMIEDLVSRVKGSSVTFSIRGANPAWSQTFLEEMEKDGQFLPRVDGQ